MKTLFALALLAISVTATPLTLSDDPKFITLSDGRVVPFGPGVICTNECTEAEIILTTSNKKWLWALPISGAIIGTIAVLRHNTSPSLTTTNNATPNINPPTITTGGNTNPNPGAAVPEPATIALLGLGLSLLCKRKARSRPMSCT